MTATTTESTTAPPAGRKRDLPLQTRLAPVAKIDQGARTFECVWTTGAPVRRYDWWTGQRYIEELSLDPAHIRMSRLQSGAPLLNTHAQWDLEAVMGVVENAWMEPSEGRATIRFSDRNEEMNGYWRDVANGIIRNISVGYIVHRYEKIDPLEEGGIPTWLAVDWEPCEISLVPVGADSAAGVRAQGSGAAPLEPDAVMDIQRAYEQQVGRRTFPCELISRSPTPSPVPQTAAAAASTAPTQEPTMQENETRTAAAPGPAAQSTPAAVPSAEQVRAEERTRINAIRSAVAAFKRTAHGALISEADEAAMIDGGITVEAARSQMFAKLEAASNTGAPTRGAANITTEQDEQEQRRRDISDAVAHRANPTAHKLTDSARRFRGYTLFELARRTLELQGLKTDGMGRNEIVSVAMGNSDAMGFRSMHGTSDFAIALASTVNRTLRQGYTSANQSFRAWARKGTLSDFRAVTRVSVAGNLTLEKVNEFGEFKRGRIVDAGESIQLATYGKVVGVTRQAVINDDLDFLSRLPMMFGRAAADFESDTVYSILKANPVMADGNALFSTQHANLAVAATGITEAGLSAARKAMRQQKDPGGNNQPLNLLGQYLIVSSDKETEAQKIINAVIVAAKSADTNVFRDNYQLIVEPRLDAVNPLEWFLVADSAQIDTVEFAYLDGDEGLFTEQRMGFDVDGIEVKARLDFAAKPIDWRGLYKNPGA